jgi:hypothetical protein
MNSMDWRFASRRRPTMRCDETVTSSLLSCVYKSSVLTALRLQHIPGDDVVCGAAGALDGDFMGVMEQFVGFIPPNT